jgi:hypothetical protein
MSIQPLAKCWLLSLFDISDLQFAIVHGNEERGPHHNNNKKH